MYRAIDLKIDMVPNVTMKGATRQPSPARR